MRLVLMIRVTIVVIIMISRGGLDGAADERAQQQRLLHGQSSY